VRTARLEPSSIAATHSSRTRPKQERPQGNLLKRLWFVSDKEQRFIFGSDAEWRVRHDGKAENVYETRKLLSKSRLLPFPLR
jgi:hypothetical protein